MLITTKPKLINLYLFASLFATFLSMKKNFLFFLFIGLLWSCEKNSGRTYNNPFIPNYTVNATLNLNLPSYSGLNSNGNPQAIILDNDIYVVIMKVAGNEYVAWNGNCPNQSLTPCSRLTITGLNAKCNCEDAYSYSMFDGSALNAQYMMIPYRVEVLGNNTIRIYN
jgi:nitrite reductase/ring-hydroxylating ferredoxin subunit